MMRAALLIGLFALAGCGSSSEEQACMGQVKSAILGGGSRAELLQANAEQMRAVVELTLDAPPDAVCSGLLIAPDWVLSAKHCSEAATITGVRLSTRIAPVLELHAHPELDLVLLRLPPGSTSATPIEPANEPIGPALVGQPAQIAGYGAGSPEGEAAFLAVTIDDVGAREISVSAAELGGACLGDSGGPLMIRGSDGGVRALGILSAGSATCRGTDRYTRLDDARPFLENLIGSLDGGAPPACGNLGSVGRCFGERAVWCDNGVARAADCSAPQACGWDGVARGFRCVDAAHDPCNGVDDFGACEGDIATRCDGGRLVTTSCASCGGACVRSPVTGQSGCTG
jgi:hypothetical protein